MFDESDFISSESWLQEKKIKGKVVYQPYLKETKETHSIIHIKKV